MWQDFVVISLMLLSGPQAFAVSSLRKVFGAFCAQVVQKDVSVNVSVNEFEATIIVSRSKSVDILKNTSLN